MREKPETRVSKKGAALMRQGGSGGKLVSRRSKGAFVSAAPLPHRVGRHGADDRLRQGQFVQIVPVCGPLVTSLLEPAQDRAYGRKRASRVAGMVPVAASPMRFVACTCMAWSDGRIAVYGHSRMPTTGEGDQRDGLSGSPDSVLLAKWRDDPSLSTELSISAMNELGTGHFLGRVTAMRCFLDRSTRDEQTKRQRNGVRTLVSLTNASPMNGSVEARKGAGPWTCLELVVVVGYESGALRLFAVELDRYLEPDVSGTLNAVDEVGTTPTRSLRLCDVCTLVGRVDAIAISGHSSQREIKCSRSCIQHVYTACHGGGSEIRAIRLHCSQYTDADGFLTNRYRWDGVEQHRKLRIRNLNACAKLQIAVSPDGQLMAVAAGECLSAFQLPSWCAEIEANQEASTIEAERVWRFTGHSSPVCCLGFLNRWLLASASLGDSLISLWRIHSEFGADRRPQLEDLVEIPPWRTAFCQAGDALPASVTQLLPIQRPDREQPRIPWMNGRATSVANGHQDRCVESLRIASEVVADLSSNGGDLGSPVDADDAYAQSEDDDECDLLALLGDGVAQLFVINEKVSVCDGHQARNTSGKRTHVLQPTVIVQPPAPCTSSAALVRFLDESGKQRAGLVLFYGSLRNAHIEFLPDSTWSDETAAAKGTQTGASRIIMLGESLSSKLIAPAKLTTEMEHGDLRPLSSVDNLRSESRMNGSAHEQYSKVLGYAHLPVASIPPASPKSTNLLAADEPDHIHRVLDGHSADVALGVEAPAATDREWIRTQSKARESKAPYKEAFDGRLHQSDFELSIKSATTASVAGASGGVDQGPELLTLGERLLRMQQQDGSSSDVDRTGELSRQAPVPVQSVATFIVQALDANDAQLLDKALAAVHTSGGVSRTVRRLPARVVLPLFCALVERFCSRSVRTPSLSRWLRALILCNASFLLSQRDTPLVQPSSGLRSVREAMHALYHAIEEQQRLREALVRLEGRLELLLAFVQSQTSTTPRPSAKFSSTRRGREASSRAPAHVVSETLARDEESTRSSTTTASSTTTSESDETPSTDESTA
ncbi:hypothetical protein CCYA_CCYA05G1692 [Cyanidiococcus yangmingshanensis]|nr:hypothetical protein CCYA_CCYA05G1692 [Cyanidiococcus yangmingshanensis]